MIGVIKCFGMFLFIVLFAVICFVAMNGIISDIKGLIKEFKNKGREVERDKNERV